MQYTVNRGHGGDAGTDLIYSQSLIAGASRQSTEIFPSSLKYPHSNGDESIHIDQPQPHHPSSICWILNLVLDEEAVVSIASLNGAR